MKNYYILVFGILMALSATSQSIESYVITSTGASLMSSEGTLYISIGEPMNTEISDGEIMISQGFLNVSVESQPPLSTDDFLDEVINVYPNPTKAVLTINIPEMDGNYMYRITDVAGALIQSDGLSQSQSSVLLNDLSSGTYFLQVIKEGRQSRTLRITKI